MGQLVTGAVMQVQVQAGAHFAKLQAYASCLTLRGQARRGSRLEAEPHPSCAACRPQHPSCTRVTSSTRGSC
jgi:hypothetical protein